MYAPTLHCDPSSFGSAMPPKKQPTISKFFTVTPAPSTASPSPLPTPKAPPPAAPPTASPTPSLTPSNGTPSKAASPVPPPQSSHTPSPAAPKRTATETPEGQPKAKQPKVVSPKEGAGKKSPTCEDVALMFDEEDTSSTKQNAATNGTAMHTFSAAPTKADKSNKDIAFVQVSACSLLSLSLSHTHTHTQVGGFPAH